MAPDPANLTLSQRFPEESTVAGNGLVAVRVARILGCLAYGESADGVLRCFAEGNVALPVSGDGTFFHIRSQFRVHDHIGALSARRRSPVRPALGSSRTQTPGEFPLRFAAALDEQRRVDRLVSHRHLLLALELDLQSVGGLLGGPERLQPSWHLCWDLGWEPFPVLGRFAAR